MPKYSGLFFGTTNAKLAKQGIATFSIPAGHSCPGAKDCLAKLVRTEEVVDGETKVTRRIVDGPDAQFRCYAASMEVSFKTLAESVSRNWDMLKAERTTEGMARLIDRSLPAKHWHTIRVHSGGDFYNFNYFLAWMEAARRNPQRKFYAYTKSLPFWVKGMALIPDNFTLVASAGGKWDKLIEQHGLRHSIVVFSPQEAKKLKLKIDHDDKCARNPRLNSFALLIHGVQKQGSPAAAATQKLRDEGTPHSYSRVSSKHSAIG